MLASALGRGEGGHIPIARKKFDQNSEPGVVNFDGVTDVNECTKEEHTFHDLAKKDALNLVLSSRPTGRVSRWNPTSKLVLSRLLRRLFAERKKNG